MGCRDKKEKWLFLSICVFVIFINPVNIVVLWTNIISK